MTIVTKTLSRYRDGRNIECDVGDFLYLDLKQSETLEHEGMKCGSYLECQRSVKQWVSDPVSKCSLTGQITADYYDSPPEIQSMVSDSDLICESVSLST